MATRIASHIRPSLNGCRVIVKKRPVRKKATRQRSSFTSGYPSPLFFTGSLTAAIAILAVDFIVGRISFFPLDFWRRLSRSLDSTILFRFRIVIGTPRRTKESTCEQELSRQNYTTSWKWLRKPFIRALPTINTQLHCRWYLQRVHRSLSWIAKSRERQDRGTINR